MRLLCITCIVMSVVKVISTDEKNIVDYFNSDTFKTIQNHWQTERKAFENAIALVLQEDYGSRGLNIYVRQMPDSYKISDGFYLSDGVVNLILLETSLQSLPIMIAPEVTFALASNYLHMEAKLGNMILNTNYLLIRNESDVVYTVSEQDAYKKSPFSFQQVQNSGELTIIAQDCNVVGYTISSFSANTVNLGLDTFKVTNCKFNIEIYSTGFGSPPVFASYFSKEQSLILETMLSKTVRAELMPKLQAAVFSYVNTSAIFGDKLPHLRYHQNSIFKETASYMSGIVRNFVQNTITRTQGVLQLKPLEFSWNKTCLDGTCGSCVRLKDVVIYGLDTAYSAHVGGPFKLQSAKVAEAIRFSTMQVRGKIYFENKTVNGEYDFSVELKDVAVNIEMEAKSTSFVLIPSKVDVTGWRALEFSISELHMFGHERQASQSLVAGYLVNEIPKQLLNHISKAFESDDGNKHQLDSEKAVNEPFSKEDNKIKNLSNEKNDKKLKTDLINNDSPESERDKFESNSKELQHTNSKEESDSIHEVIAPSISLEDSKKTKLKGENNNGEIKIGSDQNDSSDGEVDMFERVSEELNKNTKSKEGNNDSEVNIGSQQNDSSDSEREIIKIIPKNLNVKKDNSEMKTESNDDASSDYERVKLSAADKSSVEDRTESIAQNLSDSSDNEIKQLK